MKALRKLLRDTLGLAALDPGSGFEVALRVKGEGKKHKNGGKDYPGQPETAHIATTYHAIQDCRQCQKFLPAPEGKGHAGTRSDAFAEPDTGEGYTLAAPGRPASSIC